MLTGAGCFFGWGLLAGVGSCSLPARYFPLRSTSYSLGREGILAATPPSGLGRGSMISCPAVVLLILDVNLDLPARNRRRSPSCFRSPEHTVKGNRGSARRNRGKVFHPCPAQRATPCRRRRACCRWVSRPRSGSDTGSRPEPHKKLAIRSQQGKTKPPMPESRSAYFRPATGMAGTGCESTAATPFPRRETR